MVHPSYPGGIPIPTTQDIPRYPRYPPLGVGLRPHGYQTLPQDPNQKLMFITTLDILLSLLDDNSYQVTE